MDSTSTPDIEGIPPLPPGIQTTILSHLFPPTIPLPQQLLSKSLLQRHLYLPPSVGDIDSFLAPVPQAGLSEKLERLAGVGWVVQSMKYGSDGEVHLAVIGVSEEGGGGGEGVDVLFEWEGGKDGRGWTYLSTGGAGSVPTLDWKDDPSTLSLSTTDTGFPHTTVTVSDEKGQLDSTLADAAPAGYWSGFSPPPSPPTDPDAEGGGGEEDYWASYDKAFTPGGVTPANQRSPIHSHTELPQSTPDDDDAPPKSGIDVNGHGNTNGDGEGLLRSRMEMKIASILARVWGSYRPTLDPESRALTFLSLARSVQAGGGYRAGEAGGSAGEGGGSGRAGEEAVKEQLVMLFDIYGVLEKNPTLAEEGFQRLVEGSLCAGASKGEGFGYADRQDSSAQLNYWE